MHRRFETPDHAFISKKTKKKKTFTIFFKDLTLASLLSYKTKKLHIIY